MKKWLFSLVMALVSSTGLAEWKSVPLGELIGQSDLIVVATLVEVKESSDGTTDEGQGRLKVESILKGPEKLADRVLKWRNPTQLSCPRVEHKIHEGRKAIWLLELKEDGTVEANHPDRVVGIAELETVKRALQ